MICQTFSLNSRTRGKSHHHHHHHYHHHHIYCPNSGVGIAQLVELWSRDRKVAGSIAGWNGGREFSFPTVCAESSSVSLPYPCYPSGHVKYPGHCAKGVDDRMQLNAHNS